MKKIALVFFAVLLLVSLGFKYYDNDDDFELFKNIEIFQNVMKQLEIHYVDKIDSRQLITNAINKMLEGIDPYTVYYPESQVEDIMMLSDSRYVGIGITVDSINGSIYIVDVTKSGNARKAGLQIGDKIVEINGVSTKNKNIDDIHNLMLGQNGTSLNIKVSRNGKLLDFNVLRGLVDIDVVSYSTSLDSIGYIKLENFSDKSFFEFRKAFVGLKKQGIKGLIIDLRDDPGGLLGQAVDIVNLFIPKGLVVVTSRGKSDNANQVFFTKSEPVDTKIPIVVLVNGNSASASEIVSGALQDYDRAVIMGERTFGKGLVQQIFDVGYNSKLKVTVAKYYIPSGRCIQEIDYSHGKNGVIDTNANFYTSNGRIVHEGNGIFPDVIIKSDTLDKYVKSIYNKYFIFNFCTNYISQTDTSNWKKFDDVNFNDFTIFKDYLVKKDFINQFKDVKELNKVEKSVSKSSVLYSKLEETKSEYAKYVLNDLTKNKSVIEYLITDELVKRKFYHLGEVKFSLHHQKIISEAIKLLKNKKEYNAVFEQ